MNKIDSTPIRNNADQKDWNLKNKKNVFKSATAATPWMENNLDNNRREKVGRKLYVCVCLRGQQTKEL
jgi:hypothetical protein